MMDDAFTLPSRCQNTTLDASTPTPEPPRTPIRLPQSGNSARGKSPSFCEFGENFGLEQVRIFLLYRKNGQNIRSGDSFTPTRRVLSRGQTGDYAGRSKMETSDWALC